MIALPQDRMDQLLKRFSMIESQMANNPDSETYVKLASEYSELQEVVGKIRELTDARKEAIDLAAMRDDATNDAEMRALALEELPEVEKRIETLEQEVQILLLPKDAADEKNAILEIRAGTGAGSSPFAGDLFRMYERYAAEKGWRVELVSASEGDAGGYKEIIATVSGKGVFSKLKFESGVHRVQRVPETEAGGRIHTSAATVAVLPEAEDIDIEIRNEDIRIDTMRASGAGASTSIRPTRPCVLPIFRPASWSFRLKNPSTRTAPAPCRFCARASTTWSARRRIPNVRNRGAARLDRATARAYPHL